MEAKVNRVSMIKVKGGYSDTSGTAPFDVDIQVDEFNARTRTILSNTLYDIVASYFDDRIAYYRYQTRMGAPGEFCKVLLSDVFAERTNIESGRTYIWEKIFEKIHDVIENAPYNEVLDIIWYSCEWLYCNMNPSRMEIYQLFNSIFERECVGFRFIDRRIVAITDKNEIEEVEKACNCKYDGCKAHMQKAVGFLADREKKDYKNCIKESISAIESVCQVIMGDNKATLGQALKAIKDKGMALHPALERSFSALYGYTSDKGGIRHCEGLFESNVSFEEAKYMLISCSAFLNYLIAEAEKVGV